jgi:stage V sporulation protein K
MVGCGTAGGASAALPRECGSCGVGERQWRRTAGVDRDGFLPDRARGTSGGLCGGGGIPGAAPQHLAGGADLRGGNRNGDPGRRRHDGSVMPALRRVGSVFWNPRMVSPKDPASSDRGLALPSAVNLPVPPPPPSPQRPMGEPERRVGSEPSPGFHTPTAHPPVGLNNRLRNAKQGDPATEAHVFLKAYAPTLFGEAIKRILEASFAMATSVDVSEEARKTFAAINPQDAAMMVAMTFICSGAIVCQTAHGKVRDSDLVFLFNSIHPLLLLVEASGEVPGLNSSVVEKRHFLESVYLSDEKQCSLATEALGALVGFRFLAIHDTLNGYPLTSSGAMTTRMRHALLKYLHTLADCDGQITAQERQCIANLQEKIAALIQEGFRFAKQHPSAAKRLKLSPFARPELSIEPVAGMGPRTPGGEGSVPESVDDILRELWDMTGLLSVKEDIHSHINILKVSALRKEAGLAEIKTTNHMVFTGNPGTGKTTVARKLARLYRELGILSSGSLLEVDQSALVAGYVGQTAIKTKEVVDRARGGVLFIDEAYALTNGKAEESFGREAIDTLLKYMEDYRDDLIVIVAGYEQPMKDFLNSNPGLKSRFNKFIVFPDYNSDELKAIFLQICSLSGYVVSAELDQILTAVFLRMSQEKPLHFGNGRTVRNLFDCAIVRQANRIVKIPEPSHRQLMELTPADLRHEDIKKVSQ